MMRYIVDVQLISSTVSLVEQHFDEDKQADLVHSRNNEIVDKTSLFLQLIKKAIRRKIIRKLLSNPSDIIITSKDLISDGNGSIEIQDPPSNAQERLIKSLIKVLFHQMNSNDTEQDNEGQDNLLVSLFVKSITVEKLSTRASSIFRFSHSNLKDSIKHVLDNSSTHREEQTKTIPIIQSINLFICAQGKGNLNNLLQDFDKINLENECSDEESTVVSSNNTGLSKESSNFARVTLLPSVDLEYAWETLYFEGNIKQRMFNYATISLKLEKFSTSSNRNNMNTTGNITNNKLLLIHGPPGTGKTSVCRALCHKLSIRRDLPELSPDCISRQHKAILIEVSCAHIFSRWFGESAKNIGTLFDDIERLLQINQSNDSFVCIIIDEVEAIAGARSNLLNKNESSDSIRVVNTVLTRLDALKIYNNFIVLATSNHIDAIDPAFKDRADGIFFIGNPTIEGIKNILVSSLITLTANGVIIANNINWFEEKVYLESISVLAERCFVCIESASHSIKQYLIY